jgi:regulator of cell morphogenesis and NO signaling
MTINDQTLVAEIATLVPHSVRVFERFGIDFCCGGRKPLRVVCHEQKIPFENVVQAIEDAAREGTVEDRDWTGEPLSALMDHIVGVYHARLREDLPRIEEMAARVRRAHGGVALELVHRMDDVVGELSADLNAHMLKEERVLFPAIRALAAGGIRVCVDAPVRAMIEEHDRAGELLDALRTVTTGYTAPEWACTTMCALYDSLAELERDMHIHVHLENNILFPAALQLTPATVH